MNLESIVTYGKNLGKKATREIVKDITTSTALLIVASPIQAVNDTLVLEYLGKTLDAANINYMNMMAMTNESSINAKFGVALITYCGIGWGYRNLREVSKKLFGITEKTKEKVQWLHDWIYTTLYSSGVLAGGYIYSHEDNWWKIGTALAISAATQTIRGPMIGYSVDCYQDMLGFKECKRKTYPKKVKNMSKKGKSIVAAGVLAASLGLMTAWYNIIPASWSNPNRLEEEKQQIQQLERTQPVSSQLTFEYSINSNNT